MKQQVMIAEPDEKLAGMLAEQLRRARPELEVRHIADSSRLLEQMQAQPPDLLITDFRLPGLSGADLLPKVRDFAARLPVIVMAAECKPDERRVALRYGVSGWLEKPFRSEELLSTVAWALRDEVRAPDWRERLAESAFALKAVASAMSAAAHLNSAPEEYAFDFSATAPVRYAADRRVGNLSLQHQPAADVLPTAPDWNGADVAIIPLNGACSGAAAGSIRVDERRGNELALSTLAAPFEVVSVRAEPLQLEPPLPGSQPDKEIVSPAWMASLLLDEQFLETPTPRLDLMQPGDLGQHWIYQAGKYCLKTSRALCFDTPAAATAYLETYLQEHAALGEMYPDHTFFVLTPDDRGHYWLWAIAPWLVTLERELADAVSQNDEVALAAALCKFAEAVQRSLQLALQKHLLLDVRPANFASMYAGGPLVYVADALGHGTCLPDIGKALFACAADYAAWPQALHVYLDLLGVGLSNRFNREQVRQLDLLKVVRAVHLESEAMRAAQAQLIERIQNCLA
ncbi:MAG: response regulator [Acidobacteria bacterium]|nr:response regulator [Acidobacteriota bacterium]MBI3421549.1 response regulator [Acidobacteriota bacterium]